MTLIKLNGQWFVHRCNGKDSKSEEMKAFCTGDCLTCRLASPLLNLKPWNKQEDIKVVDDGVVMAILRNFL